jgi:predicted CxxxxCH...CXXCH cytochrome family protein
MRPSFRAILLALAAVGLGACDARPASGGGGGAVPTSGAHTVHLTGTALAEPIVCTQCHNGQFDVTLEGPLASANGAQGSFNATTMTCSNVYCHSGGPELVIGGGTMTEPVWIPPSTIACGSCHALPGAGAATPWHPVVAPNVQCGICHPGYPTTGVNKPIHVNGKLELTHADMLTNCQACHGDSTRVIPLGAPAVLLAAPPLDRAGSSDTRQVGVGAHQAHLLPGTGAVSNAIACTECHAIPTDLTHVGPTASTPASFQWGTLATAKGAAATFDLASATCTNYCHGATLTGGAITSPDWTEVNGTQARCGTCHGDPPTSGAHVEHASPNWYGISCGVCHPVGYSPGVVGPAVISLHVNGVTNMNPVGFANWNPSATPSPVRGTLRGTATGCHGGTRYWTGGAPLGGCQ